MTTKFLAISGAGMFAAVAAASVAAAQAKAPAPAPARPAGVSAAPVPQGAPIPGLCVLSVSQAISGSTVGKYVSGRMNQIVGQVKAELGPVDTAISTDGRALETARPTLDAATFQSRASALSARITDLRKKADLRQREVEETEKKAVNRIGQELDPIARQLYQDHRCSVLFDKGSVMIANPQMDLTAQAVTALNAKIQQFAFDREHLDAAAAPRAR
ncbi:MAG: OmpH family outer membrane protein [Caulobacteraceae bacterium]|nr:OmpH family outer membrane protein [Caulobacteraceae bacterium]